MTNIPQNTPNLPQVIFDDDAEAHIVRRCNRQFITRSFVQNIRHSAEDDWSAPLSMTFHCHAESGDIMPRVDGKILPREQFDELILALQQFYEDSDDTDICAFNTRIEKMHRDQNRANPHSVIVHTIKELLNWPRVLGHVYVIRKPGDTIYKVGYSKDVPQRMKQLRLGCEPEIVHLVASTHARFAEQILHCCLDDWRLDGEWFTLPLEVVDWLKTIPEIHYPETDTEVDALINLYDNSFCMEAIQ